MKFLFRIKLGRIWFLVWFLSVAVYLVLKAIRRYIEFKTIQFDNFYDRNIDSGVMNFYLSCIILSIVLGIFCVYCTVMKTGNYANDYVQFGSSKLDFKLLKIRFQQEQMSMQLTPAKSCCTTKCLMELKCHFPPLYLSYYVLMSGVLLMALPYLEFEKMKNDLSSTSSPFHSNLDFIFQAYTTERYSTNQLQDPFCQSLSFEFFNLCISLLLFSFSYSQVFWMYSKKFTVLFSIILFLSSLICILDTALVEMLVKISCDHNHKLHLMKPSRITVLSLVSHILLAVHLLALFKYGYIRLKENLLSSYLKDSCNHSSNMSSQTISVCKAEVLMPFVVGFVAVVLSIASRLLYLYRSITVIYPYSKEGLILSNLIVTVFFFLLIMILWICLLVKSDWSTKTMETAVNSNGVCSSLVAPQPPVYASVVRQPISTPPGAQNFPMFCAPGNSQWRYSCSPPSCGANDSNSDRTMSGHNGDSATNAATSNSNYVFMRRANPLTSVSDSPTIKQGIYSHLIKLTPQTSFIDNNHQENIMIHSIMPIDTSETSSNQTVHIRQGSQDLSRGTLERSINRSVVRNAPEYLNIVNFTPITDIYDQCASLDTDAESVKLCSQV